MSRLRVLMYHKISPKETDFLTVKTEDFRKQMSYIKRHFQPISLSQMIDCRKNNLELPRKALLVTFDDGYLCNYEQAYPILKELSIPFCVFLVANYVGKSIGHDGKIQDFMNKEQLETMRPLAEYGYHSMNHENLMDHSESQWDELIGNCTHSFDNQGIKMEPAWAYTYGAFPKKDPDKMKILREILKKNGIFCAFRIGNRINGWPLKRPFKIERMDIRGNESVFKFKLKVFFGKLSI